MTPETIKKHALTMLRARCSVYEVAKKTLRHGPGGPFTIAEDLLHGAFDGIGFEAVLGHWLLAQWTSLDGMSARRRKIEEQFLDRLRPPVANARLLDASTRVELWGYVARGKWRAQCFNWKRWAWSLPYTIEEDPEWRKQSETGSRSKRSRSSERDSAPTTT